MELLQVQDVSRDKEAEAKLAREREQQQQRRLESMEQEANPRLWLVFGFKKLLLCVVVRLKKAYFT